MEAILNFLWLVIALAAIWRWRFCWSVSRQDRKHSKRIEGVAMVCILALLFPVISLTDDLHPETVAVDAAAGKRNACLVAANAAHVRATSLRLGTHFASLITPPPLAATFCLSSELSPSYKPNALKDLASPSAGRSPPSLA
jgi:hypothetical protein